MDALIKIYRVMSEKAQKNASKYDWNLIRSHNVRKWFNSALLNSGADSFFVEFLMGHTLDATRTAYFRASPEKLRDLYQKFIPYLTIQKEINVSESEEYKRIKEENDILRAETERHIVERTELQELRADIEELKQMETNRAKLQEEFKAFTDEEQKQSDEVEEFFGMSFDEAMQRFAIGAVMTPDSEEYKAHMKKLRTDKEYRLRYREYRVDRNFEKVKLEKMENINSKMKNTLDKFLDKQF